MAIRNIIEIDEELCDGCGECVPSCVEGALRIINGKARLVSNVLCDGLGACLGQCPTGALTVIEREAPEFDEVVAARTGHVHARPPDSPMPCTSSRHQGSLPGLAVRSGSPTQALAPSPATSVPLAALSGGGCPGSRVLVFEDERPDRQAKDGGLPALPRVIPLRDATPSTPMAAPAPSTSGSRLRQWPVQLHLVPPTAPFFQGRHVLLAADCVPVAVGDFHSSMLDGRGLAIACPKLDQHLDAYVQKLAAMIDDAGILSLTVAIMEVPCCGGLVHLAQQAQAAATRKIPLRLVKISIRGDVLLDVPV